MNEEINKIVSFHKKGHYNEALVNIKILLLKESNNPILHNLSGIIYLSLKDYEKSIESFTKAISLKNNLYPSYLNRGIAYIEIRDFQKAIEDCKKTIELKPNTSEAYNYLGIALKNKGNKNESIEYFVKALNYNSKNAQAYENLIKVLTHIEYNKNQDNKYIYVNNELKKLKFDFKPNTKITDETIKTTFETANKIINNNLENIIFNECQIYRKNKEDLGCKRHKKIFNEHNVIPNNCFGCYKVIIEPKTVIDLVKLYILFDNIKLENNNIRKCMIELRPNVEGRYKCLVYCSDLNEAESISKKLKILIDDSINNNIVADIKRGCSEFGMSFPQYKDYKSNSMKYDESWKEKEELIDNKFPNLLKNKINKETISGITLNDILVIRNWICFAKLIDDNTYKMISEDSFISTFIEKRIPRR
jgi:tetratricopeptide (TPR) repeat protein